LWRECPRHPELGFDGEALAMIRQYSGDLHGKKAWDTGPYRDERYGQTHFEFNGRMSGQLNPLLTSGLLASQVAETPAKDARFWEGIACTPWWFIITIPQSIPQSIIHRDDLRCETKEMSELKYARK
jgi:hypothetical protein